MSDINVVKVNISKNNDIAAAIMSAIIPGLGQAYKGHVLRGLVFLGIAMTVIGWPLAAIDAYFLDRHIHVLAGVSQSVVVQNNIVAQAPPAEVPKSE